MPRKKKKIYPIRNLPGEEWALVNGTEDYYTSNLARFRRGNKLRKVSIDPDGHLDTDKQNCKYWNLEWVTQKENARRAGEMGLMSREVKKVMSLAIDGDNKAYLFDSQMDCAKQLGLNDKSASKVSNGKQPTTGGYRIFKVSEFTDRRAKNVTKTN